jgi:hypothetical protein
MACDLLKAKRRICGCGHAALMSQPLGGVGGVAAWQPHPDLPYLGCRRSKVFS